MNIKIKINIEIQMRFKTWLGLAEHYSWFLSRKKDAMIIDRNYRFREKRQRETERGNISNWNWGWKTLLMISKYFLKTPKNPLKYWCVLFSDRTSTRCDVLCWLNNNNNVFFRMSCWSRRGNNKWCLAWRHTHTHSHTHSHTHTHTHSHTHTHVYNVCWGNTSRDK